MDNKRNPNLHAVTEADGYEHERSERSSRGRTRKFFQELSQRKVCRTAITYSLLLWLNLQIGDVMFPIMGLPDWTLKFVMFIGFMGFPVVLLLAWTFQITARGIELDLHSGSEETAADKYLDRVVSLLLLTLSITLTGLLVVQIV